MLVKRLLVQQCLELSENGLLRGAGGFELLPEHKEFVTGDVTLLLYIHLIEEAQTETSSSICLLERLDDLVLTKCAIFIIINLVEGLAEFVHQLLRKLHFWQLLSLLSFGRLVTTAESSTDFAAQSTRPRYFHVRVSSLRLALLVAHFKYSIY